MGGSASFINVTVFGGLFTFELLRRRIASCGFIRPRAAFIMTRAKRTHLLLGLLPHLLLGVYSTILVDSLNFRLITQLAKVKMQNRQEVIGQFVNLSIFWATIKDAAAPVSLSQLFKMSHLALYNFIIYNLLQINLRSIVIFHCWPIPGL